MSVAEVIVIAVGLGLPILVVAAAFVWAAVKDGREDAALQKRLGIRRRSRLGR